jgi:membrane associated rhomboid family serine protease
MRRYPSSYASSFSFGPGPISTALKALIGVNVAIFVAQLAFPIVTVVFGLHPAWIVPARSTFPPEHSFWVWQVATYMFLHGGIFHIVFNMLALWMFGAELERMWGTRYFLKFYLVTGIGAGLLTVVFSLLPFGFARQLQYANVIGASGAIYGLLLAYAMYFPNRPIYMYFVFPIPAKIFVAIMGGIAFISSLSDAGGVANATHLGGLLIAYLFLKSARMDPLSELKYRYLKWKINRVRKKFDVYSGGRADDWDRRVH